MIFSRSDREQIQYLLPTLGNIKSLEIVEGIVFKIENIGNDKEDVEITLDEIEIRLLQTYIKILDQSGQIHFSSLSLVKKINSLEVNHE